MKDNRYMKCETITGEWWYKDLQTGEDLPEYATPIIGLEKEPEILTRWQDPTIGEYKKEIDRLNNIIDELVEYGENCLENLKDQDDYICESVDIVSLLKMIHHNYIDKLKELKGE